MSPAVCGDRLQWSSGPDSVCARPSGHDVEDRLHVSADLVAWGASTSVPVPSHVLASLLPVSVGEVAA